MSCPTLDATPNFLSWIIIVRLSQFRTLVEAPQIALMAHDFSTQIGSMVLLLVPAAPKEVKWAMMPLMSAQAGMPANVLRLIRLRDAPLLQKTPRKRVVGSSRRLSPRISMNEMVERGAMRRDLSTLHPSEATPPGAVADLALPIAMQLAWQLTALRKMMFAVLSRSSI
jgi:hypothetical protein